MASLKVKTLFSFLLLTVFSVNAKAALSDHFVTTWKTDNQGISNDTSIRIFTNSNYTYSYKVDWDNDGIFDEFGITGDVTHDFGTVGIKTIRISGNFPSILAGRDKNKIISIDQWGSNPWKSFTSSFAHTYFLINKASDTPNLLICNSLESMFRNSVSIGAESELANWDWDTSHVYSMSSMFENAYSFNQDIGNWDTGLVYTMDSMFKAASNFNQDIGNWNTTNVYNLSGIFSGASAFNQDLSEWNVESVTNFKQMFNDVSMSVTNYEALLIGWASQALIPNKNFDGGNSIYCSSSARVVHDYMINSLDWVITDGGICESVLTIVSLNFAVVDENQIQSIQVEYTDPDSDSVIFTITGGEDRALFSINSITGEISFKRVPDYENPLDIDGDNVYLVEVTLTDNGIPLETATQLIKVYVNNINENLVTEHFVTTWDTDSITLNTNHKYGYNYNIDWDNDGVFDDVGVFSDITHNYGVSGLKTIRVSGIFPKFELTNINDKQKIISIDQWGSNEWLSMEFSFISEENLVMNAQDVPNLFSCLSLKGMFLRANLVGALSTVSNWNWKTPTIVDISSMFKQATSFNQSIGSWDTNSVINMSSLFENATSFNQNISDWDTSNVLDMSGMFLGAITFNRALENWDTAKVIAMYSMFEKAASFDQNIGQWNIESVIDFANMFATTKLSVSNYEALLIRWSSQNIISNMVFNAGSSIYCSIAAQVAHNNLTNINGWTIRDGGVCKSTLTIISPAIAFVDENSTQTIQIEYTDPSYDTVTFTITGGEDMALFSIDSITGELSFVNLPDYENPVDLDANNSYLVEITLTDDGFPVETASQLIKIYVENVEEGLLSEHFVTTWDTESITILIDPNYAYNYKVDWDNDGVFDDTGIIGNITHSYGYPGLKTIRVSGKFPRFLSISPYNNQLRLINQWGPNPWLTMKNSFAEADNLILKSQDIPNLSRCTSLYGMFKSAFSVGAASESANWAWNTETITDLSYMFAYANSFNQPIGSWDTSQVNNMSNMFREAYLFNQSIGSWNTDSLIGVFGMFRYATSFNQSIGNWNTSSTTHMGYMFRGARSFNQDISEWDISNVRNIANMFQYASDFDQDLSSWNVESVSSFSGVLDGTNLSIVNYDTLLTGWASQNLQSNRHFNAGSSIYCSAAAQLAHDTLTNTYSWNISDGGVCQSVLAIVSSNMVSIDENHTTVIKVVTTDPDFDTPTFSLSGGADMALFTIDTSSGLLSFISPPDFENPLSSTNSNSYQVEVSALDDGNPQEIATQLVTVNVTDLVETSAVDLIVDVAANVTQASPGDTIVFTLSVSNIGVDTAVDSFIFDVLPMEISHSTWTCTASGMAICGASGTGEIVDSINLPNDGSTIIYTITATVTNDNFTQFDYRVNADTSEPQYDTNLADNADNITILGNVLFSNSFE